jgi:phage protein D
MADAAAGGPPMAAIKVGLAGADLTDKIAPRLVSLKLSEKRGEDADELEIQVHDHDSRLEIPPEGALLDVALGWKRGPGVTVGLVDKGKFKVDEVSWAGPPDILTIKARSADFTDGFRVRREKKWKGTTVGAVLQEIAGGNGLKAAVDSELASIALPVLAQDQRSDAAMLRFLGRRFDAVATVKAGALIFSPIGKGSTAGGAALPSFVLTRKAGDSYRWSRPAREDYGGCEARWHDKDKGTRQTVKEGGDGKGKPKRLRRTFHSETSAKHAAKAEHNRIKRAAASFELTLGYGSASLYPEQKGQVQGFKPSIDSAAWLISEVEHELDGQGGFRTRLKLETDA